MYLELLVLICKGCFVRIMANAQRLGQHLIFARHLWVRLDRCEFCMLRVGSCKVLEQNALFDQLHRLRGKAFFFYALLTTGHIQVVMLGLQVYQLVSGLRHDFDNLTLP